MKSHASLRWFQLNFQNKIQHFPRFPTREHAKVKTASRAPLSYHQDTLSDLPILIKKKCILREGNDLNKRAALI